MSEYWIISAPGDKTCQQTFDTMNNLTSKQHNLCSNYKFHIPDLKVGTLDQLVGLSDDLGKLDTYVEQITRKVAMYLGEVLEDQRDKLQENLQANNSPGPPDEVMPCRHHNRLKHLSLRHQRKHQHTHHQNNPLHYHPHHHHQLPMDIKAAANNIASSATTTYASASASACASAYASASTSARASASACPGCPAGIGIGGIGIGGIGIGSGGSLNNLSSTHDESEREFDFVIPPGCACDECYALSSSSVFAPPSASATASTLMADECYSQTASSMLNATRCAISTVTAIATGSSMLCSTSATAAAAAATTVVDGASAAAASANAAPAKTSSASTLCSSAYFSTSAPTASSSVHSMSRSNSKKLNNNTCSINNNNNNNNNSSSSSNKLSFRSTSSHISQLHMPQSPSPMPLSPHKQQQQQQHKQQQSPKQQLQQLQLQGGTGVGLGIGGTGAGGAECGAFSPPLLSPTEKSCDTDLDLDEDLDDPKSPHSASSLSETFDWWFNKPKRNSKKCRSSPVSSCCGSSSQGRSSPDTDHAEPPEFPLSPVYCSPKCCSAAQISHSPRLTPNSIKLNKTKLTPTHTHTPLYANTHTQKRFIYFLKNNASYFIFILVLYI
ncbi:V-type proton ATPase subunit C isoform X4 [Drosophila albomicans]|uniref:V-type proton ATPase subunit C n=1 Tax=Drosophila albomicans TaxID=7291 RepID=A0A9C6T2S5_DROAB|nr:V-type proton ATPase subunit C isoform X4 [Drosophila albomicans]